MTKRNVVIGAFLSALIAGNFVVSARYVVISTDPPKNVALVELPGYTRNHIQTSLARLHSDRRAGLALDDGSSEVVTKLDAAYTPADEFFTFNYTLGRYPTTRHKRSLLGEFPTPGAPTDTLRRRIAEHNRNYLVNGRLTLQTNENPKRIVRFDRFILDPRIVSAVNDPARLSLIEAVNPTLFNGWGLPNEIRTVPVFLPYTFVHDHLITVPSELTAYGVQADREPWWRYEPDYFAPSRSMEAIGRYLLFNIVNAAPRVRFVLTITETLRPDGQNRLPPASVVSGKRYGFATVGRGSARVFSEAFTPERTGRLSFAELDMGVDGRAYPERRTGLMKLFGNEYSLDARQIVGFVRDISVVSDQTYHAIQAPRSVAAFPRDLFNDRLEYSGVYEDGWVGEDSYAWLAAPRAGIARLVVRGSVPNLNWTRQRIGVFVDGRRIASQPLVAGTFEVAAIVPADGQRHKIAFHFDRVSPLPNGDRRPVSALLTFFGYD